MVDAETKIILDQIRDLGALIERREEQADARRRDLWKEINGLNLYMVREMSAILARVEAVEKAVASASPTLSDYQDMRKKAEGAGLLGRTLWRIGGWLIAGASTLYATYQWLQGR
ncbi:hypothetical protein [Ensifer sp. LBL]|uniref:hypothetical protein n=1 Tax=Ensifer sp. LBL TaxID=2991056 RepID=UPI003D2251C7